MVKLCDVMVEEHSSSVQKLNESKLVSQVNLVTPVLLLWLHWSYWSYWTSELVDFVFCDP